MRLPPEGLQVEEIHIPGNVIVTVPIGAIQQDERYFESATEFRLERWGSLTPLHRQPRIFLSSGANSPVRGKLSR